MNGIDEVIRTMDTGGARPIATDGYGQSPDRLQRFGNLLQRRQEAVRGIQWTVVALYLLLLLLPALTALTPEADPSLMRLTTWVEMLFWGVWWPGVVFSVMLFGQFWCGLLCPDGTLTECASRHGRAWKIPLRLRWAGWPLLAFTLLSAVQNSIGADGLPPLTLLLGGTSLAALLSGYCYARGKRIWCRYLCPAGAAFSLLSRCAAVHFKVDRSAWDAARRPLPRPVDCPQLLDVRRLAGNAECSMCGRCSGHRNAVALAHRAASSELENLTPTEARPRDAFAICFVLIGVGFSALHGAGGLVQRGWPNEGMTLNAALDGTLALLLNAALLGGGLLALLLIGTKGDRARAALLSYSLIPLGGVALTLGAFDHAAVIGGRLGLTPGSLLPALRTLLIAAGVLWSLKIGHRLIGALPAERGRSRAGSFAAVAAAAAWMAWCS
ncbi:MAG: 4Fe-4S binding protein [Rhodocyclaceae bacterium]|jgi:hypothetical protein|nr:4Fe-4S binding protein [Rhodocyclaceae bacterium]